VHFPSAFNLIAPHNFIVIKLVQRLRCDLVLKCFSLSLGQILSHFGAVSHLSVPQNLICYLAPLVKIQHFTIHKELNDAN
jgi:hypothetical protein